MTVFSTSTAPILVQPGIKLPCHCEEHEVRRSNPFLPMRSIVSALRPTIIILLNDHSYIQIKNPLSRVSSDFIVPSWVTTGIT